MLTLSYRGSFIFIPGYFRQRHIRNYTSINYKGKISEVDSPSLVNWVRAASVSTENARSWLPAFPRSCNQTKGRERNKKKNFEFFDEYKRLMYSV